MSIDLLKMFYLVDEISVENYFEKSCEFRDWLLAENQTYLEDLDVEDAKKIFKKGFVKNWNKGKLDGEKIRFF